jgi:hypothetical protein
LYFHNGLTDKLVQLSLHGGDVGADFTFVGLVGLHVVHVMILSTGFSIHIYGWGQVTLILSYNILYDFVYQIFIHIPF